MPGRGRGKGSWTDAGNLGMYKRRPLSPLSSIALSIPRRQLLQSQDPSAPTYLTSLFQPLHTTPTAKTSPLPTQLLRSQVPCTASPDPPLEFSRPFLVNLIRPLRPPAPSPPPHRPL